MGMARPSSGGGARPGRTPARRARAHLPAAPRRSRRSRAPPPRPRPAPAPPGGGPRLRRRPTSRLRPGRSERAVGLSSGIFTDGLGVPLPLRGLGPVGQTLTRARGTSRGRQTLRLCPGASLRGPNLDLSRGMRSGLFLICLGNLWPSVKKPTKTLN
ncbi:potassium/sodium hyperpolarization-activated cyclic nucleotide-gated channel 2-like [Moschus berezovskii]|uniref:potassium/sodium hyperpolarization-activated cyclic nucleotide-gated channel 2-like n=1 Tax=Moschus berezovskii TaxID=68408 RepID=UPI0024438E44|nr:potassium/sodium hyperpolarization-activated cyclic nucleotide-gated channel 2-like [Moschus berezovskii]